MSGDSGYTPEIAIGTSSSGIGHTDNLRRRLKHVFGGALVFILAGYAFFGRGFAYIHLPLGPIPLYIGEIVLAVGMLAGALTLRSRLRQLWNAPCLIYLAFALWGACLTVPYLGIHGINAIRDAALVYYGLFMVLVLLLFQEPGWIKKARRVRSRTPDTKLWYLSNGFWIEKYHIFEKKLTL